MNGLPPAWALLLAASLEASQAPPVIETSVEMVSVDVSVLRDGRALTGLGAADFEVRDDGERRETELAATGELPLHVLLTMDVSASVAGSQLSRLQRAAKALLDELRPIDRAGMLSFSQELRLLAGTESSPRAASALLMRLTPGGGTALRDAAWAALQLAERVRGRCLVLLFSDAEDSASWLTGEAALAAARESNAVLHVIHTPAQGGGAHPAGAEFLARLAESTGGRLWSVASDDDPIPAVKRALAEMRSRYVLRFERPRSARVGWHRLEVRLKQAKAEVRARRGYFVPAAKAAAP